MSDGTQSGLHSECERDERLESVIAEYIRASEAGNAPSRRELLEQYPELAADLKQFLSQRDHLNRMADPIREFGDDLFQAIGPGQQLSYVGNYELLEEVARGGMGIVYKARQKTLGRMVAVKMIVAGRLANEQDVQRFQSEAQAAASLQHPNIVSIHEVGQHEGWHYFSMDYVDGSDLSTILRLNLLSDKKAAEYVRQMAEAIHYAHLRGILHRDLKPSNILIDCHDQVRITDFGLAMRVEGDQGLTQTGQIVGTPSYMPPEQAQSNRALIGPASDVYALGAILYECLTGRPPFRAETVIKTIDQVIHVEAASPRRLNASIPRDLETICLKCLEKEPHRRYGTAQLLAEDLGSFLCDEPITARPVGTIERTWRGCRRNPAIASLTATVVLCLIVGTTVSSYFAVKAGILAQAEAFHRHRADDKADLATQAEGLAQTRLLAETEAKNATREQLLLTKIAEERATRQLFDARLAQAKAGFLSRRVGQRFDSLTALEKATKIALDLKLPAESFLELRNAAISCLALPDLHLVKQWPGWPVGSGRVDFDGKLEHYARVEGQDAVSIRRVADDVEIGRLPATSAETWLLFSRDGNFLAIASLSHLTLWNLRGHQPVPVGHFDDAYGIDFSSDSRQCAIGRVDGPIRLYDLASGLPPRDLPKGTRNTQLAFHPEGLQLAVSCGTSVEIRDLDTGKVLANLLNPVIAHALAWHPEGNTLAVVGNDSRIYLWDVAAGKQTLVLEGIRNGGIEIAFNHSGDRLASIGWDGIRRLWDPLTGKLLFSTTSQGPSPARFSLDDRLLAGYVPDGKLGLWEIAAGGEYRTLVRAAAAGRGLYHNATIRFDGRLLAVGMHEGVGLWDLASGRELAFLQLPGMNMALFEPLGGLLTNGVAGLLRWPVQADPATPALLRIGPPLKLSLPGSQTIPACSRDGRVVASPQIQGGLVLHLDRPERPVGLTDHEDVRYIAVSPDGRWVATGSHGASAMVKVWEAQSGNLEKELSVEPGASVGFSPDGKWLVTGDRGCRLWAVETWRAGPHIDGVARTAFAFSPDSKLLAMETGFGVLRLLDPDTGREYARLEDPHQDRSGSLSFTPDGTQLVTTNNHSASIHVWNLRAIREKLAKLELDWDLPQFPTCDSRDVQPLRMEVDLGELGALIQAQDHSRKGRGYVKSSQWDLAIGDYANAIELDPKNAEPQNNLAWLLATCPDVKCRDSARAIELTKKAMELAPNEGFFSNTLGVAHYRAGDWPASVAALEKSNELLGGKELSFNAFFLAMAHWQQGNHVEARNCYDQAVEWMEKNKPQDEELRRFRTEAAELLKLENK